MIAGLLCFGGYFYAKDVEQMEVPGWIPLIALMVYVVKTKKTLHINLTLA